MAGVESTKQISQPSNTSGELSPRTHTVAVGESVHSILRDEYERLSSSPALPGRDFSRPTFPATLSADQARWLIGLMVHYNPGLIDDPHSISPGQKLVLPGYGEIAQALVAGAPSTVQQQAMIDKITDDVFRAFADSPFFPSREQGETELREALADKPKEFEKYSGSLQPSPRLPKFVP